MKIAVKTKITEWGTVGDKEKISFDLLDFSPDQVADIDRLIRNNNEDPVRMKIEVIQKKLEILPIESQIRLVSMNCMSGGQKLKIADFKSPDTRATALKRMVNTDTQVTLTIEGVQGNLFEDTESAGQPAEADDEKPEAFEINDSGVVVNPRTIDVKFPKAYRTVCNIKFAYSEKWFIGFYIKIGLEIKLVDVNLNNPGFVKLADALDDAAAKVCEWLDSQEKYKYKKQAKTAILKAVENYLEANT
jgi:hypothetical protein